MTPTANPTPTVSVNPSIHGPYEDLGIELLKTLQVLVESQTPEVRQKLWTDYVNLLTGFQTLAGKLDVFHLFTAKS